MKRLLSALFIVLLSGCASLNAPSADLINEIPVVEMGAKAPEGNNYILHVPAEQTFPVQLSVAGSLFTKTGEAKTQASFKRDVYLYKHWVSYNGKDWQPLDKLLALSLATGLGPEGGIVKVEVDERP